MTYPMPVSLLEADPYPAVTGHPVTGRRCWFDQIAFRSEWTIEPEIREYLLGEDTVRRLSDTCTAHTTREPWQPGALVLVDNPRTAHSREAYEGPREVLVATAQPLHLSHCTPTPEVSPR
jgi:alpha-ketoglutarate-dependent taurine dioxygenase